MKKTLLLMFAFIASVGAWGQTNLASGKTVKALGGLVQTSSYTEKSDAVTAVSEANLANATADNNDLAILVPQPTGNWSDAATAASQPVQGFYVDLGEGNASTNIGTIRIVWETADVATSTIKIFITNTEPSNTGNGITGIDLTGATQVVNVTDNTQRECLYNISSTAGRYVVFQGAGARNVYGAKMQRFEVYSAYTPALTTVTATADKTTFRAGNTATITAAAYDQAGLPIDATISYSTSNSSVATVSNGIVTGVAAGSATITISAEKNGVTKTTTIDFTIEAALVLPETAPAAPTGSVHVIYDGTTGEWADAGWGWGGNTQSNVVIDGKTCRMGENLGGMQIANSLTQLLRCSFEFSC